MIDGLLQVLTSVFECSNLLEGRRTAAITHQMTA